MPDEDGITPDALGVVVEVVLRKTDRFVASAVGVECCCCCCCWDDDDHRTSSAAASAAAAAAGDGGTVLGGGASPGPSC